MGRIQPAMEDIPYKALNINNIAVRKYVNTTTAPYRFRNVYNALHPIYKGTQEAEIHTAPFPI